MNTDEFRDILGRVPKARGQDKFTLLDGDLEMLFDQTWGRGWVAEAAQQPSR